MTTFFLTCLVLGGGVVLLQLVAGALGFDSEVPSDGVAALAGEGLDLLSVRSLAAGLGFFGAGGLAALGAGLGPILAVIAGVGGGALGAMGVAASMRALRRLESDRTFRLAGAVGQSGRVYLGIPGRRSGAGKVHIALQGRLMELEAVTPEEGIGTGAPVLVIDTIPPATVVVVPQPSILEEAHGEPDPIPADRGDR